MAMFFLIIVGLAVGSFINVVVVRLAAGEKLTGRSQCRNCRHQLSWYYNIPVLSFLYLRGRCAWCQRPISWQYPVVEAAAALFFGVSVFFIPPGDWLGWLIYLVLVSYLLALFVFDFKYMVLPDSLTLSGTAVLLILNLWYGHSLGELLGGMVLGGGLFVLQYLVSKGKWVGAGDIRFGLLIGAALGWRLTIVALLFSYWLGAIVALVLLILKRAKRGSHLPFGAFLAIATLLAWVWGEPLWRWYINWLGF
ncbi:MAG: prepilin peptidase [Candidatus Kerfeldbacteria bacterium]|nr:prepilin peptidase [Candidatus Kerfeldbacteria bacterium]